MAKDRKAQQPNGPTSQQPEKTRVTAYLPTIEAAIFSSICDLLSKNSGDGLSVMVWTTFNSLENGQREAVAAMARAKTGVTRLPTGPKTAKSAVDAQQGGSQQGGAATASASPVAAALAASAPMLPGSLEARTAAISARYAEAVAPLDAALHEVAGGN